jgi:hypothetical protein
MAQRAMVERRRLVERPRARRAAGSLGDHSEPETRRGESTAVSAGGRSNRADHRPPPRRWPDRAGRSRRAPVGSAHPGAHRHRHRGQHPRDRVPRTRPSRREFSPEPPRRSKETSDGTRADCPCSSRLMRSPPRRQQNPSKTFDLSRLFRDSREKDFRRIQEILRNVSSRS